MGHPRPLSRPVGPSRSSDRSVNFSKGSKSLFTDPAITTRPFPMLWPHSHAIANHFPIGHPSFHYSSSSTLNSRVLSRCAPEKITFSHITTRDVTIIYVGNITRISLWRIFSFYPEVRGKTGQEAGPRLRQEKKTWCLSLNMRNGFLD
ncbi:hypothetical protein YC2023_099058 [Brassica napus]